MKTFVESLVHDVRYALRGLKRHRTFTVAAVLTLALGIGANTAIFSVVNSVLLKPLAYPDSDRLVSLSHTAPGVGASQLPMSPTMYVTYRDEGRTFQDIGIWGAGGRTLTGLGDPEQMRAVFSSYGVLQVLGVQPTRGRWFTQADESSAGPEPVILSYSFWQRKFGGQESALGQNLTIDAQPSQVVGVMPKGFKFLTVTPEPDVFSVLRLDRARLTSGSFGPQGIARLKPGVTLADARADAARILPIWLDSWPFIPGMTKESLAKWGIAPAFEPLKTKVVGGVESVLWVLMGTIGAVLLIACANIANLLLVRADARRQEFGIRSALGATHAQIAKVLLVESLVLGALGGVLGLTIAYLGLHALVAMGPNSLPRLDEIGVDRAVLVFATAASLVSSLLFGSLPAWKHASNLVANTRGATASRDRHRTRSVLVVVQVALALVLLVSSGLMIRTFQALRDVDPGFTQPDQIQVARISITGAAGRDPGSYTQLEHAMLDRITALPGVTSAAFASAAPMEPGRFNMSTVFIEDRNYSAAETPAGRRMKFVSPGYFATMGTRMIAGRDITWTDLDNGGKVAVISENFAREVWGTPAAALGRRIHEPAQVGATTWREIVGVVQDVHEDSLDQAAPSAAYWPVLMAGGGVNGAPAIAFVVRSERAGNESFVGEIRQAVWSFNSSLPVFLTRTMQDLYADSLARTSFTLVMLAIAGAMALGLGVIGIYGVMAYVVSQRTREIGIRLALGASPTALQRMFALRGLGLAAIGVGIGLVGAVALTRLMASLLYGVGPLDPTAYVAGLVVLFAAAGLASYLPARRAATVNPVETLKAE